MFFFKTSNNLKALALLILINSTWIFSFSFDFYRYLFPSDSFLMVLKVLFRLVILFWVTWVESWDSLLFLISFIVSWKCENFLFFRVSLDIFRALLGEKISECFVLSAFGLSTLRLKSSEVFEAVVSIFSGYLRLSMKFMACILNICTDL